MSWENTRLLTNGEHDELWRQAFESIPYMKYTKVISNSLRNSNMINILKELHDLGVFSDEEYARDLMKIAESEGYNIILDPQSQSTSKTEAKNNQ